MHNSYISRDFFGHLELRHTNAERNGFGGGRDRLGSSSTGVTQTAAAATASSSSVDSTGTRLLRQEPLISVPTEALEKGELTRRVFVHELLFSTLSSLG
jgi:hypothetical protein